MLVDKKTVILLVLPSVNERRGDGCWTFQSKWISCVIIKERKRDFGCAVK